MALPNKNLIKNITPLGFTLVEVLIVVGIFSIVATMAIDIFLTTNRTAKKSMASQQVQSAMRFAIENIAREIHQGTIDYAYDPSANTEYLYLRDTNGQAVRFRKNNTTLQINRGEIADWQPLLANEVNVVAANFYVEPDQDPFAPAGTLPSPPNEQPRVTFTISAQPTNTLLAGANPFFIQTTVVSRTYKR